MIHDIAMGVFAGLGLHSIIMWSFNQYIRLYNLYKIKREFEQAKPIPHAYLIELYQLYPFKRLMERYDYYYIETKLTIEELVKKETSDGNRFEYKDLFMRDKYENR